MNGRLRRSILLACLLALLGRSRFWWHTTQKNFFYTNFENKIALHGRYMKEAGPSHVSSVHRVVMWWRVFGRERDMYIFFFLNAHARWWWWWMMDDYVVSCCRVVASWLSSSPDVSACVACLLGLVWFGLTWVVGWDFFFFDFGFVQAKMLWWRPTI